MAVEAVVVEEVVAMVVPAVTEGVLRVVMGLLAVEVTVDREAVEVTVGVEAVEVMMEVETVEVTVGDTLMTTMGNSKYKYN